MKGRRAGPVCILTVAGLDSGGGAGVLADAKAIQVAGGHALAAVTAVTAQNLHGVKTWRAEPARLIAAQIEAVLQDFDVRAVKTGLLSSAEVVRAVARALRKRRIPLVVDPVLAATTGAKFLDAKGVAALKGELFPLLALLTPNWPEAQVLAGRPVRNLAEATAAARALIGQGCRAVLVKGGHGKGQTVTDVLVTRDSETVLSSRRVATENTHGTGCVLSASIAAELAQGQPLTDAIRIARRRLIAALAAGRRVDWGGRGPAFSSA